jgi:hypothetical protein
MITTADAIRNHQSHLAEHSKNASVLGVDTLIQTFRNPAGLLYNFLLKNFEKNEKYDFFFSKERKGKYRMTLLS